MARRSFCRDVRPLPEPLLGQSFYGWYSAPCPPLVLFGARPPPAVERGLGWGQGGPPLAARPPAKLHPRSRHFKILILFIPRHLPLPNPIESYHPTVLWNWSFRSHERNNNHEDHPCTN